jgi:hypothetical protein
MYNPLHLIWQRRNYSSQFIYLAENFVKAADDDNRAPAQFVVKVLEDFLKERGYLK